MRRWWRLSLLRSLLEMRMAEDIEEAEEMGVWSQHPFDVSVSLKGYFMVVPEGTGKYLKLPENVNLHKEPPLVVAGEKMVAVLLDIRLVYVISKFLVMPDFNCSCRSGIRFLSPPRSIQRQKQRDLKNILKKSELVGFTKIWDKNIPHQSEKAMIGKDCSYVYDSYILTIYVGDESDVQQLLRYRTFRSSEQFSPMVQISKLNLTIQENGIRRTGVNAGSSV